MKKQVATFATAAILSSTFSSTAFAHTYTVQHGDTLFKIAKKNNTTVGHIKAVNNLSSDTIYVGQKLSILAEPASTEPSSATSAATTTASAKTYTVVSGDTLIAIANRHGISLAELKSWNGIESHIIYPGQVLYVSAPPTGTQTPAATSPAPVVTPTIENANTTQYVIKKGDTLSSIATRHRMSVQELKSYNNLTSDLIFPGQTLKLTAQGGSVTVTPTPVSNNNSQGSNVETAAQDGQHVSVETSTLITEAKRMLGVPYEWGGSTPAGFDCSGFISYVFTQSGKSLTRMSSAGYYERAYYVDQPQVGDLVFFENTYTSGISHMGIYLGNNQFIHAGATEVEITSMASGYWKDHFDSFKRFY